VPIRRRVEFYGGILAAVIFLLLAGVVSRGRGVFFPPFERPVMEYFAAQDMGTVLNGARRLGADLAFIQLMQYYGTAENADPNHPRGRRKKAVAHPEEEHEGHGHMHLGSESAPDLTNIPSPAFPQMAEYVLRVGSLDPRFHFAYLFASGALAFNLNRGEEAMAVLNDGIRHDPHFWRYRLYQGAFAYRKDKEVDQAIANLELAIQDPECPSMIKNILANLHIKQGNSQRAFVLYLDLLNSRDKEYSARAEQQLRRFGVIRD
jgi:tetratricopeptide (TPR) repeat protein